MIYQNSDPNCFICKGTGLVTVDEPVTNWTEYGFAIGLGVGERCICTIDVQKIKPDPTCKICHGQGEVYDVVDYGSTTALLPSYCNCVEAQIKEGSDEIELVYEPEKEQEKWSNI